MELQQIYQSSFLKMTADKESSYLELHWSDPKEEMDRESFKQNMLAYRDAVVGDNIGIVLNNSLGGNFVMTPDIQEWIANEVFPHTVKSLHKIAFVMPWNLIQKLAMEQMIEEYESKDLNKVITSRYFKSIEEAKAWLFE